VPPSDWAETRASLLIPNQTAPRKGATFNPWNKPEREGEQHSAFASHAGAAAEALEKVTRLEKLRSRWSPASAIARTGDAEEIAVRIDPDLRQGKKIGLPIIFREIRPAGSVDEAGERNRGCRPKKSAVFASGLLYNVR
jgi:hypothetical protein